MQKIVAAHRQLLREWMEKSDDRANLGERS